MTQGASGVVCSTRIGTHVGMKKVDRHLFLRNDAYRYRRRVRDAFNGKRAFGAPAAATGCQWASSVRLGGALSVPYSPFCRTLTSGKLQPGASCAATEALQFVFPGSGRIPGVYLGLHLLMIWVSDVVGLIECWEGVSPWGYP